MVMGRVDSEDAQREMKGETQARGRIPPREQDLHAMPEGRDIRKAGRNEALYVSPSASSLVVGEACRGHLRSFSFLSFLSIALACFQLSGRRTDGQGVDKFSDVMQ